MSTFADIESLLMRHCPRLMGLSDLHNAFVTSGRRGIDAVRPRAKTAWKLIPAAEKADYMRLAAEGRTPAEIAEVWTRSQQAVRAVLKVRGGIINSTRNGRNT
jgi:hypothetical protein